ncbi:activity-regulated cytoskeleton associated protein 2-like [Battus philenor]|uniref:activity-regulated cytoskeleton associated protein 2-like n=1 Tax=Battus philenor TaxID=42288 RepID=UPI0035D07F3E
MPRRKAPGVRNDVEDEDSGRFMTEGQLSSFMVAFAKAQARSNRQLLESLLLRSPAFTAGAPSPSPSPSSSSAHPSPSGNFAGCTARFNGASRDSDILEAFIDAIVIYKECINIADDDHALRGLPMLLEGEAAVWFRGVKASIASWEDALQRLRAMYGAPRPPYKIFRDIFASE